MIFIRVEPLSGVPIYRQILDQIKVQIATGLLQQGDQMPSVRQLAGQLAVNQNTVLKVYNQLCQEKILRIERGSGTFVAVSAEELGRAEAQGVVAEAVRGAVTRAVQFGVSAEELVELVRREYEAIEKMEGGQ